MLLNPHYGADPVLVLEGDPRAILVPTVRQRQRLAATVAGFTDGEWTHPSRCDGWSSRDVIVHLDGTNFFWTQSIAAGLRGDPTRFLATFDPVTSPAQSVAQSQGLPASEVRDRFVESTNTLVALLESLGADDWTLLAEAPPGHVGISAVAHHALWDAWIHERDILLPLAADPIVEVDEVTACLRYAAALGPLLARSNGIEHRGRLALHATDPDADVLVEIGDHVVVTDVVVTDEAVDADLVLSGPAADMVDMLSIRRPVDQVIPSEVAWMLEGLSTVFDNP
ncbi:MAG TPA: maleylpyruvate isomerase family mycothiol-dependent enzyme [Ilumatobacteraceae bacterium]|nr:maleylpyruvate isomerase family mycothiol-dependent enzyme [Ilumatobacteraceae bacterium]